MDAFSALIYIKPNTATDEKIAVGLLASGINKVHFAFSKIKLNKAFALANMSSSNNPIERYLKNIAKSINEDNTKEIHFSNTYILNKEYINYLNRYDNGIVYFEKPTSMAFSLNDNQFAEIFKLMLGDLLPLDKHKHSEVSFSKSIHSKIEKRTILNEKADIIYSVEPVNVKGIGLPIVVDYISVNGSIYAGMHIDFNTEPSTIIKHYYEFKNLAVGLDNFSTNKKYKELSNCSIYFNNPEGKEQKDILDRLRKDDTIKGVTLKEAEQVEKDVVEIEKKNCRKFSEELAAA
jgi:hypothetical protein